MVSQSLTGMTLLHPEQDEANSGFSVLQFGQIAMWAEQACARLKLGELCRIRVGSATAAER
jgi:hypothetical protein